MKKMKIELLLLTVFLVIFTLLPLSVSAHSGRTDSSGGHYNRSTGEYHYHHGVSAHDHYDIDGDGEDDCPIEYSQKIWIKVIISIVAVSFTFFVLVCTIDAIRKRVRRNSIGR